MHKHYWLPVLLALSVGPVFAQDAADTPFSQQEMAVIEAIKAQNRDPQPTSAPVPQPHMQAPASAADTADESGDIKLSNRVQQQAWEEQQSPALPAESLPQTLPAETEEDTDDIPSGKCLTVAYIDIDEAFNQHPRTQAVKKQIEVRIQAKQREVESAKSIIDALEAENRLLSRQLAELKPFYERIVTDQPLLPKVPENADELTLENLINRLLFAGSEVLSTTPLNTPARLDDITERIGANKRIIAERSFFIDNYKYQTREEILNLEQKEVKAILQDIYSEIKSFAQKRNIGAVVRKDQLLYGQEPVNVTKDFVNRLKKSKKYRKL